MKERERERNFGEERNFVVERKNNILFFIFTF